MSHERHEPAHNLGPERTKPIPDGASYEAADAVQLPRPVRSLLDQPARYIEPKAELRMMRVPVADRQLIRKGKRRRATAVLTTLFLLGAGPIYYAATDHPSKHSTIESTTGVEPKNTLFNGEQVTLQHSK
jgi:hypothetical protein